MIAFYNYKNYFIMTFGSIAEIISAMNWLSLINKKYNYLTRYFRIFSIIFVRLPLWFNIINLFRNTEYNILSINIMLIFIGLDIYWLKVIHSNMNEIFLNKYIKINKKEKSKYINNKKDFYITSVDS
jgi:hypothetical protein